MSRDIKFRAWNPMESKMIDLKSVTHLAVDDIFSTLQPDGLYLPLGTKWEIMQLTGLQDVNGVDIYEGDIVRAVASLNHKVCSEKAAKIIFSHDYQWQVGIPGYSHGLPISWGDWDYLEVIGNIHENPELLQVSS